ncbi:MAG: glycosyltransferase, partial [Bacteroidia bacterium]|nr:glycosyltransferase [Bacteroidia bacterium]
SVWLQETLESILKQSYSSWECLVIDDGSTDSTALMVASFCQKDPRIQYHKRPDDLAKGANSCRNYGFQLSKGNYIQWFDDDDIMLKNYLKNRMDHFTNGIEMVACTGYKVDESLQKRTLIPLNPSTHIYKDYALRNLNILTPSALFRKSFLEDKQGFNSDISRGQEAEFFMRIFYKMNPQAFVLLDEPLFLYRQHDSSKSAKSKNYNPKFIEDQTWTYIENLKRSVALKDPELVQFFYKILVRFFFSGVNYGHKHNAKHILKSLLKIVGPFDKSLKRKLNNYGRLSLLLNKGSYKMESSLVNHKSTFTFE